MKKQNILTLGIITLIAGFLLLGGSNSFAATSTQSIIIPMYKYPNRNAPLWDAVYNAGSNKVPFTIVNPGNGPGADPMDANYTQTMNKLKAEGYTSIGYVNQDYARRDINAVAADIDLWFKLRPDLKGIFIDEMASGTLEQRCYVANIYNYIKVKHPGTFVIQNPGTYLQDEEIAKYSDIFTTFEAGAEKYLDENSNRWRRISNFERDPQNSNRIYHIVHSINSASDQEKVLELSRARNAGFIYFTGNSLQHYRTPSAYFNELLAATNLPKTQPYNGNPVPLPEGCQDVFDLKVTAQNANPATPGNNQNQGNSGANSAAQNQANNASAVSAGNANLGTVNNLSAPGTGLQKNENQVNSIIIAGGVLVIFTTVLIFTRRRF